MPSATEAWEINDEPKFAAFYTKPRGSIAVSSSSLDSYKPRSKSHGPSRVTVVVWIVLAAIIILILPAAIACAIIFGVKYANSSNCPAPSPTVSPSWTSGRLPTALKPTKYWLQVQPYFPWPGMTLPAGKRNFHFDGSERIVFTCLQNTMNITLNSHMLTISSYSLFQLNSDGSQGNQVAITNLLVSNQTQQMVFFFLDQQLQKGMQYTLRLQYTGTLSNATLLWTAQGFYAVNYQEYGQNLWMVGTNLEAMAARLVFPCFDEPAYKAKFTVEIIHWSTMQALSNGMENGTRNLGNGWAVTSFQETPMMSTYLLAIVVHNFTSLHTTNVHGTLIRTWCRSSHIISASYAFTGLSRVMDYFTDLFGVLYPLPKLDMLAMPMAGGAMENWGLIISSESAMLVDPRSGPLDKRVGRVPIVVAHEAAHLWFGDLVTMKWWDDIFLNEGFAQFWENAGIGVITNNSMEAVALFDLVDEQAALAADETHNSHPVVDRIPRFDTIQYEKATWVKDWNGTPLDVGTFMNPWVLQMGYPIINVTRNYATGTATLTQNRFRTDPNVPVPTPTQKNPYKYQWFIPIWYQTPQSNLKFVWMKPNQTITLTGLNSNSFLLLNPQMRSFYRASYDSTNIRLIQQQLMANPQLIDVQNRAQMLDDIMNFLPKPQVSFNLPSYDYTVLMKQTQYLGQEMNYIPWATMDPFFTMLDGMFQFSPMYPSWQAYITTLITAVYNKLGWNEKYVPYGNYPTSFLRVLIHKWACYLEVSDCVIQAKALFKTFMNSCPSSGGSLYCNTIPPDLKPVVYCTAVAHGEADVFNRMMSFYNNEHTLIFGPGEKQNIAYGLSCARDTSLIQMLLSTAVNTQDTLLLSYLNQNYLASQVASAYLINNLQTINSRGLVSYFITGAASKYSKQYQLTLFQNFGRQYSSILSPNDNATLQRMIQNTKANIAWVQTYGNTISKWLQQTTNITIPTTTTLAPVTPTTPSSAPPTTPVPPPRPKSFRLPTTLRPLQYLLTIQPYYPSSVAIPSGKNFTFDGQVTVTFVARNVTNLITLNALNLQVDPRTVMVRALGGNSLTINGVTTNTTTQQLTITLRNALAGGYAPYTVSMSYTGIINPYYIAGLFRTSYTSNGKTTYLLATQFESTRARMMLPCFDEPGYKAIFQVTIIHPSDTIALSNGIEEGSAPIGGGLTRTTFADSPIMSSYLLAIAIGPFTKIQSTNSAGTQVRIWAWPGMENYMAHGLETASKILDFMGSYFSFQYPLPKADLLALPEFGPGAMENWGLVIFKYQLLLYNSKAQTANDKITVEMVIAHELAHMWFGDLVTMQWWDDIFLNEGFANYWEYVALENVYPSQRYSYNLLMESVNEQLGLMVDQFPESSHPLIYPAGDGIIYEKGSDILRMLNYTLGHTNLQQGLVKYLQQHAYNNANHNDLWASLTNAATGVKDWNGQPLNVATFMNHWTLLRDYPLLTVTRNYQTNTATISQTPFNIPYNSSATTRWYVPVWYTTTGTDSLSFRWLSVNSNLVLSGVPAAQMLVVNPQIRAFARVNYDQRNWRLIAHQLNTAPTVLDVTTRAQLISDSLTFISAGLLDYATFLNLTQYLHLETALTPWQAANPAFTSFWNLFLQTSTYPLLRKFLLAQIAPVYNIIGWNASLTQLDTQIPPDFRSAVYCSAIPHMDTKHFMQMFQFLDQEMSYNPYWYMESTYLVYGLSCATKPSLVYKYLDFAITNLGGYGSDLLAYIGQNPTASSQLMWPYLEANYQQIIANGLLQPYLNAMVTTWNSNYHIQLLNIFLTSNNNYLPYASRQSIQQAIITVKSNINWLQNQGAVVASWLAANYQM